MLMLLYGEKVYRNNQNSIFTINHRGGNNMIKDGHAPRQPRHNKPKKPDEQRRAKGKSNARNTNS